MASILGTDFSAGLDPFTSRLFQIESGGDPNAVTGSNQGLGQFGPAERGKYGITDSSDPAQNARAVARERQEFTGILQTRLGRDPTPGEVYLMHQQGIAGGPALLTANPDVPAWQAIKQYYPSGEVAKKAITGNIPRGSPLYGKNADEITAGDFSKFWVNKFEGSGIPNIAPQHGIAQNVSGAPISSNFPLGPQGPAPQTPALGAPQQPQQQQQQLPGGFGGGLLRSTATATVTPAATATTATTAIGNGAAPPGQYATLAGLSSKTAGSIGTAGAIQEPLLNERYPSDNNPPDYSCFSLGDTSLVGQSNGTPLPS